MQKFQKPSSPGFGCSGCEFRVFGSCTSGLGGFTQQLRVEVSKLRADEHRFRVEVFKATFRPQSDSKAFYKVTISWLGFRA